MRKILLAIALGLLIAPVVLAVVPPPAVTKCTMRQNLTAAGWVSAGFKCPAATADCAFDDPALTCGACCLLDTIYTITDWIFYIVVAIAIIFIVLGALSIITAGGSPEKVTTGRNYILYAVIGLIIGLAAKMIPSLAKAIVGLGG